MSTVIDLHGRSFLTLADYSADELCYLIDLAARLKAAKSMGPKVRAACAFVEQTGGIAAIGSIAEIDRLLSGEAGTTVALAAAPTT